MKRNPEELVVDEHPLWSPTRLDTAETCMKYYWMIYVKKLRFHITPAIARGKLFHYMVEHFWKIDPHGNALPIPKYSYEGFVNVAGGVWKRYFSRGIYPGAKKSAKPDVIDWDYKGQQWDSNYIGEIQEIAGKIYTRYVHEEPRVGAEVRLGGVFEGVRLMAIIDEVRKGPTIRDHKSGVKRPQQYYLEKNIQMTDYLVCLYMALKDKRSHVSSAFPEYYNTSLEDFLDVATIEIHHLAGRTYPKLNKETKCFEYPEKEPETGIYTAKRTVQSVNDLVLQIQVKERQLRAREFPSHGGRQCDFCLGKHACSSYNPEQEHAMELSKNMPLFAFCNLSYGNMKNRPPKAGRQKPFRFKYAKATHEHIGAR